MRKHWLLISIATGVLAIGIVGGTVLAQAGPSTGSAPAKSFASRVATILGLDEAKVQSAINQASKDMQDEAIQSRLDRQVQQGRITQAQADQFKKWYQSRPDGVSPRFPLRGRGFHFGGMGGVQGSH